MFGKIAGFELRYQIRQPIFWIAGLIFFLLVFASVTIDQIQIGSGGNVHKNSPNAIAETCFVMSLFFMFASTAFVANVIVRDDETGYGPIIRSTPIRKFDYLFGRFAGAFAAVALAFLFVPAGIFVGSDAMSRAAGVPTYIADMLMATALLCMVLAILLTRVRVVRG